MTLPRPSRQLKTERNVEPQKNIPAFDSNTFRPSDIFSFEPLQDITVYELAILIKQLYEPTIHFKSFLGLPDNLQRHFNPHKA
jgi:hypothetical protein